MSGRDSQFPATSIGRTQGTRMQQTTVPEAHPLLSGSTSSVNDASGSHNGFTHPRYVPYTPRHRAAPTVTTGTTVHPPSPQHLQGDATSKLQLTNAKAVAQNVGLDTGSVGWAILEKLVLESETGEQWSGIWSAVTSGKATLVLPVEPISSHDKLTPDFLKDHVVLSDGSSRKDAPVITLSGLRGILDGNAITFYSSLHPSSKLFQDLLDPATRTTTLLRLPPLPLATPTIQRSSYPSIKVTASNTTLALPPRAPTPAKPPLPPRPGTRATSTPSITSHSTSSRIPNPFASLFGSNNPRPATPPVTKSPPTSIRSLETPSDPHAITEVPAIIVEKRIQRKDITKNLNKALRTEIKESLKMSHPMPSWVIDRVRDVTESWFPFIRPSPNSSKVGVEGREYTINPNEEAPEDAAERLQEFYLQLEQDMRAGGTPFLPRTRRNERDSDGDAESEKSVEKREMERMESEGRIREVMENVERTICSLFYDRLFMQPLTDDASHDEALSNRVAALNMLDLGLEHLDIEVGEAGTEVNSVVQACGEMLSQLSTCHSPGDKAAILVAAHKIVVDGLSRLPPIRLMSEEESKALKEEAALKTARPKNVTKPSLTIDVPATPSEVVEASLATGTTTIETPKPIRDVSSSTASFVSDSSALSTTDVGSESQKGDLSPISLAPSLALPRPASPLLSVPSAQKEATPVSGDVLLPMIIFAVVKANPPQLVSNLLFTQRFRNQSIGGEESYCLINLMAVAEFLENVDLAALGLGDSDKVMSTADLTPITITRSPVTAETPLAPADGIPGSLRGRVEQQVDAIAGSANKVISGVVDSSFGILRSLLPNNPDNVVAQDGNAMGKPGFGLLRRESGFSIASLAASLPIAGRAGTRSAASMEETGQQLMTVSRPGSIKSFRSSIRMKVEEEDDDDDDDSGDSESDESGASDASEGEEGESGSEDSGAEEGGIEIPRAREGSSTTGVAGVGADARSIQSFESMLSESKKRQRNKDRERKKKAARGAGAKSSSTSRVNPGAARKSLSDRLASVSALVGAKGSPPPSRRSSLLAPGLAGGTSHQRSGGSPASSRPTSPVPSAVALARRLPAPSQKFLECSAEDLRISEVAELLSEYKRLVQGVRDLGGFDE